MSKEKRAETRQNPAAKEEEPENIITLVDEDGAALKFELLDLIGYSADTYAVLVPAEEDADQVVIFKIENPESEDNTFIPVTDQELALAIFNLFKEKNRDLYDFSED